MKLDTLLLWPALFCVARATSDAAIYLFPNPQRQSSSIPPTLTPAEARLVIAHRLGVSQYHDLAGVSEDAITYINDFGGLAPSVFGKSEEYVVAELVLLIEGLALEIAKPLLGKQTDAQPAFRMSMPPSTKQNQKLVSDFTRQSGSSRSKCPLDQAINPFDESCWNGKAKILHVDIREGAENAPSIEDLQILMARILNFVANDQMHALIVLVPEPSKHPKGSYGTYDMPYQRPINSRALTEESVPFNTALSSEYASTELVTGVIPTCFASLDACVSGTNNCSSHGQCARKFKSSNDAISGPACFTCFCGNTTNYAEDGTPLSITSWGGGACQKKDISAPFWLITISSLVLVGLVSWAIGMLFSIGDEKLPGVIGAGVSSRAR